MTETEWLASEDPAAMLAYLLGRPYKGVGRYEEDVAAAASDRKMRLFACACCRLKGVAAHAVDRLELYGSDAFDSDAAWATAFLRGDRDPEQLPKYSAILRDIVGNPFHPVTPPPRPARKMPCGGCGGDSLMPLRKGSFPVPLSRCLKCRWEGPPWPDVIKPAPCPWLTPQVLTLATAAYEERGRECRGCEGRRKIRTSSRHYALSDCLACHGTGTTGGGTLDGFRLMLVAEALEDAGCVGECAMCHGTKRTIDFVRAMEIINRPMGLDASASVIEAIKTGVVGNKACLCNGKRLPSPLLEHLRSPGSHYRGMWSLDLILGKE